MGMKQYAVTLEGQTPLLMHQDNIAFRDAMAQWMKNGENKKNSKAGDDRTPAWTWIGTLYHDAGVVAMPSDNLMTMMREGGAKCPTGKGQATFKRQTQSGLLVDQIAWPVMVNGKTVSAEPIIALAKAQEPDFAVHEATAQSLGFELFVKCARIGQAKHVRVRPRFNSWSASGSITVLDETITKDILLNVLSFGGRYSGLGDWRPSSPKSPGQFGTFTASIKEIK